ncbi:MAG: serine/threonine-protein kinase [Acidobacteriota bacterium]
MSRARELFERWVEARVVDGRTLDLDTLAAGDATTRRELAHLIAGFRAVDEALPSPSALDEEPRRPPPSLERYTVLELLGEGGMGEVWAAEQVTPIRRPVALKVIKKGLDTAQVMLRFESERQALAAMDHPAIAKVFDAGVTDDGRPYFAMERVDGEAITVGCDRLGLSIRERLELFVKVCDGVQHAHQKGIIHRDLKPSNILVRDEGGILQPRIIDFGIAKAVSADLASDATLTQLGQVVGTPAYMSPEQADLENLDVDTRSDVYSLGVLLFELLVGVRPFAESPLARLARTDEEPPTPSSKISSLGDVAQGLAQSRGADVSTIRRLLKGELDWVALKALHPDRSQRYDSPARLAEDLRRTFRDEPVLAGPPGAAYQVRKFISRHRVGVGVGGALVLAIAIAVGGLAHGLDRALEAEQRALAESRLSQEVADFLADLFERSDPKAERGESMSVRQLLDRGARRISEELADQPLVQARLLLTMARSYRGLGDYAEARALHERAVEILQREEPESLELAQASHDLAETLIVSGALDAGEASAVESLELRRRLLPEQSLPMSESYNQLGMLRWRQGRLEEALEMQQKALDIKEQLLGPADGSIAKLLNNVAILRWEAGDLAGARELMERGLAIFERDLGPRHPHVASNLNNLGLVADRDQDYASSVVYHRRALAIREEILDSLHPDIAESLNNLGVSLMRSDELDEARRVLERAVEIRLEVLGESHVETASSLGNLGQLLGRLGEAESGRGLVERARSVFSSTLGPDHHYLAFVHLWLAELDDGEGDLDGAARHLQRCREIRQQQLGDDNPLLFDCVAPLADVLRRRGEPADADEIRTLEALAAEFAHGD